MMRFPTIQRFSQVSFNIPRYFLYTAFKGFGGGLIAAFWLIYLQQRRGFSLTEATFIDVAFWIAATLGEVPTGVVADTFGRKLSLVTGSSLLGLSILAWAFAPTMPLIMIAYMGLAIGTTFLSGAEDAFLYESLRFTGRADDYTRLAGRASAVMLGATALGSLASGFLATLDLIVPFLIAALSFLLMLGFALAFKEPRPEEQPSGQVRKSYGEVLRQSITLMRERPTLRFSMLYLTLVPLAAVVMETFFLQPQTVALGVPIAGIGVVAMAIQIADVAGSTLADRTRARFGERRILYAAPAVIVCSLILLAVFQIFPALLFVAAIGFTTAVLRPVLLNRIQSEVPDDIRATLLSVQSLMFTFLLTIGEPILGFTADRLGLPAAYLGLASSLGILILILFWMSQQYFPKAADAHLKWHTLVCSFQSVVQSLLRR